MTEGGAAPGTYSFRCSACGRCCNSAPQLSLPELFRRQGLFVGALAISVARRPGPDDRPRFAITALALEYASLGRCPALSDGRCTLHGREKPATCALVPLDALATEDQQHAVLARRAHGVESVGSGCLVAGEREGFAVLMRAGRVVEPAFQAALARRRADLASDARIWGRDVFELLRRDLFSSPAALARIPANGFLSVSLAPALIVLADVSGACRRRCLEYLDAQRSLMQEMIERAIRRGRREDRPMTEQLRAWSRSYEALATSLRAGSASRAAAPAGEPSRAEIEAWLGCSESSPQPSPQRGLPTDRAATANPGAGPAPDDELRAQARELRVAPEALNTYLEAGAGRLAPGVQRSLHATIKPGGAACNLDCTYCYYLGKQELLGQRGRRMDDALLEAFIADYIASQDAEEIAFTWHGGEPTLLGLGYFRRIVALQKRHTPPGRRVSNDLQTNGTLLSDAWCAFLAEHRFLVGLSIDGPRHLHDLYRRSRNGRSSGEAVLEASGRLRRHGVRFGTLTTVNRVNATMPRDVYRFLRDQVGSSSMQFIPCVEPTGFDAIAPGHHGEDLPQAGSPAARPGDVRSAVTSWSVDPDDWGRFLCATFDEWGADAGRVKVNLFETLIAQLNGRPALICTSSPYCGKNVAVEHDGRVYSCDHYVYPEHELGRIGERSIGELVFSRAQLEFGLAKRNALARQCRECPHLRLCWGECPRTRLLRTRPGEPNLSYLCRGWRRFFDHALPVLERMGLAGAPRPSAA